MHKTCFSLLIIHIVFSLTAFGQNLRLTVLGNNEIETKILDSLGYAKQHKDFTSISNEIDSIKNKLLKIGFLENKTNEIKKINDSVFSTKINLNRKYNTIYIYYDKNLLEESLLGLVSKQINDTFFSLPIEALESKLQFLNSKIASNGIPFTKLKLDDIEIRNDSLKAALIITTDNNKRLVNSIAVKGYEKFPRSYLKHYLKIKENQIFNLEKIKSKTERLNNLRFANQIRPPEVLFSKDSTTVYLYLEKTKSNTFDGFLGFGTNEDTNKLQFDGYLNLNLTNNLNYGESFKLLYKSDENDQKTFQSQLALPYLFSSPLGVDLQLYIFKRDSSFTTVNQSAKLHYQINPSHKVYFGANTTTSNNLLSQPQNTTGIIDFSSSYLSLGYQFIKPQLYNFLFPFNSELNIETGIGKRKTPTITENQSLFDITAYKIFNFNSKNSFFLKTTTKALVSKTYFENELFRFGGINSIRGFEENSLLASFFSVLNTEYRLQFTNTMYINTIIDLAYTENKLTDTKEKLFGYGFGFGILTKSGLLKLNYANGKTENQKFKLSNSKIHISLTANF